MPGNVRTSRIPRVSIPRSGTCVLAEVLASWGFRYVRTFRTSLEPRDLEQLGLLGNLGSLPRRRLSSAVPAIGQWSAQGSPDFTDIPENPISPDLTDFSESQEKLRGLDVRTSRFVRNLRREVRTFRQVRTYLRCLAQQGCQDFPDIDVSPGFPDVPSSQGILAATVELPARSEGWGPMARRRACGSASPVIRRHVVDVRRFRTIREVRRCRNVGCVRMSGKSSKSGQRVSCSVGEQSLLRNLLIVLNFRYIREVRTSSASR